MTDIYKHLRRVAVCWLVLFAVPVAIVWLTAGQRWIWVPALFYGGFCLGAIVAYQLVSYDLKTAVQVRGTERTRHWMGGGR